MLIDLAMPGPERLSSEAILMGAIPIMSNIWAGSSELDFPLSAECSQSLPGCTNKINPYDSADISKKLKYITDNYESELNNTLHNSQFFNYILVTKTYMCTLVVLDVLCVYYYL